MYNNFVVPNSKHLFQKVVHDVLDCLTAYEECVKLLQPKESEVFNTLSTWNHVVEKWRLEILSLAKHDEYSDTGVEWIKLLDQMGLIIQNSSNFKNAMQSVRLVENKTMQRLIETATRQSEKLELINQALKEHKYQKLMRIEHW